MGTLVIKRGDLWPSLTATLTGTDEETGETVPVDLTTAASIRAVGVRHGIVLVDRDVTGNDAGEITMAWESGDTDAIGYIRFEFIVTWPNAKEQTFPQEGFELVRVSLDGG